MQVEIKIGLKYFSSIKFKEHHNGSFSISGRSLKGIIPFSLALIVFVHLWLFLPQEWPHLSITLCSFLGFGAILLSIALIFGFSFRIQLNANQFRVRHKFLGIPYKSISIPMSTLLDDYKGWKKGTLFFSDCVHLDYGQWGEDDDYIEITDGKMSVEIGNDKTSVNIMRYILQAMKSISLQASS